MGEQAAADAERTPPDQAPVSLETGAAVSGGWEGRVLPANTGAFDPGKVEDEKVARLRRERRVWWGWVLATTLTWTALTGLVALVGHVLPHIRGQDEGWEYVLYLAGGVVQSRVIHRYVPGARWWAAVTAAAAAIAVVIHLALFAGPVPLWRDAPRYWRDAVVTLIDFGLIAVAQWLWLRRRFLSARWWLVASIVPTVLLALVGFAATAGSDEADAAEADGWTLVLSTAIVAVLVAVPMASTMIRLLRRPVPRAAAGPALASG